MTLAAPVRPPLAAIERLRLRVRGQVQGVGFRPTVHRLAHALGLSGWVRNDAEGVLLEVQGPGPAVRELVERLQREAPPLARIGALEPSAVPLRNETGFVIVASPAPAAAPARTAVTPDTAPCVDCLAELFDPQDRRWRHAFINCTHCGPRFTLTRALPYDRATTSMAGFAMCPACATEYADPADRRFHAQPNACPDCGPQLRLRPADSHAPADADPVAATLARLRQGAIVALKGAGGYQLACDARSAGAVARLRQRKARDEKPLAVMVANVASAAAWATVDADAAAWLSHPARPIVLCPKRDDVDAGLPDVAPGLARLGLMLPSTPLHLLLFHEAAGRPAGTGWLEQAQPLVLVMTSANPGGEPLVRDDDEAVERLAGLADAWLWHDRAIVTRVDDSVLIPRAGGAPTFVRRARGFTPQAIELADDGPSVLALGGLLKNTVCLTRGREAFVSQHIGSLDNPATCAVLQETVHRLMALLAIEPERIAHDRHPDVFASRWAAELAQASSLPRLEVQHHHAHLGAVAAEHGVRGPLLGLALDGFGLGDDGGAWGGELLRLDGAAMRRLGHLQTLPLPGGDRAAREPWRMAAAALQRLGRGDTIAARFAAQPGAGSMAQLLASPRLAPPTSSAGRWFDAAAALAGLQPVARFEGQAAMRYEALAAAHGPVAPLAGGHRLADDGTLELLPLLAALADEPDAARAAALFHATLAEALADWAAAAAAREGLRQVALGGGCFLNQVLIQALEPALRARGLDVLRALAVPPNDGGLSLGQAWVARQAVLD